MIGCFSDAFYIDGTFYGKALEVALLSRNSGIPSCLIAPLSSDEGGMKVINRLIEKEIFFDPDLIFPDASTPSGLAPEELENSVFMSLKAEMAENVLSLNPEFSLFYVSPLALSRKKVAFEIASALKARSVKVPVILDFSECSDSALALPFEGLKTVSLGQGLQMAPENLISCIKEYGLN